MTVFSATADATVTQRNSLLKWEGQLRTHIGWQSIYQQRIFSEAMQAYEGGEYYLARRLLQALAQRGNAEAQFQLGLMYDNGEGLQSDSDKAIYWYLLAAAKQHPDAQYNMGVAYAQGLGVLQDINKAIIMWRDAAMQGHRDAQYNLGIVYATGRQGVNRNIREAAKWWRKAALAGDAMAQYNLGALYANGMTSEKSYCEATRWWEKSAKNGMSQAKIALQVIKRRHDYVACGK